MNQQEFNMLADEVAGLTALVNFVCEDYKEGSNECIECNSREFCEVINRLPRNHRFITEAAFEPVARLLNNKEVAAGFVGTINSVVQVNAQMGERSKLMEIAGAAGAILAGFLLGYFAKRYEDELETEELARAKMGLIQRVVELQMKERSN